MYILEAITIINLIINISLLIGVFKLYFLIKDDLKILLSLYKNDIEPTIIRISRIENALVDIPSNIENILLEEPIKLERTLSRKIHEIWKRLIRH